MHNVSFTFFLYQLGFTWLLDAGWESMTLGWWPTLCIKHNFSCRSQHEHNLSIVHYLMLYGVLYIYTCIYTYIHIISYHINSYAHKILAARHLVFSDIFVSVSVRITCAWGDTPRTSWYDFWEDDPSIFRSGLREHLHETPNQFGAKNQPVSCRFSQPTLW